MKAIVTAALIAVASIAAFAPTQAEASCAYYYAGCQCWINNC